MGRRFADMKVLIRNYQKIVMRSKIPFDLRRKISLTWLIFNSVVISNRKVLQTPARLGI